MDLSFVDKRITTDSFNKTLSAVSWGLGPE